MKEQICETLCDIMDKHPNITLFSIISVIVLIIAVIIEWAGMTNIITATLCVSIPLMVAIGLGFNSEV